jgi:hypothetical protein
VKHTQRQAKKSKACACFSAVEDAPSQSLGVLANSNLVVASVVKQKEIGERFVCHANQTLRMMIALRQ